MMNGSSNKLTLEIVLGQAVPSFKNSKRIRVAKNGKPIHFTEKSVKHRMQALEDSIGFALYSECHRDSDATGSACLRQLQTALSGLSDDSLNQISEFSFGVEYVKPGMEGVRIEIEQL